jgi:hypothetical protein
MKIIIENTKKIVNLNGMDIENKIVKILKRWEKDNGYFFNSILEDDYENIAHEIVKLFAITDVSGNASERYRKALSYIRESTFEPGIGIKKASYVLEKALKIASGYNVD